MKKEEIIELTNKIYKLTLFFPKKEPLKYKMRDVADSILEGLVGWNVICNSNPISFLDLDEHKKEVIILKIKENLEVLKSYFEIAKWQNWVSYFDFLKVEERYKEIDNSFKKEIELFEKKQNLDIQPSVVKKEKKGRSRVSSSDALFNETLNQRKRKILKFLKEKGKAQVWQIKEIFPDVTKRTLRRDFEQLLKKDIIIRIGEKNNTFYKLKK